MIKRCIGCGAILQSDNKNESGYTPDISNKYCMRCFRLTHYNDLQESNVNKDNNKIIDIVNKQAKLVFFLIDFLNINSTTINTYQSIKSKKVLCITKSDIIPKSIKETTILAYLTNYYNIKDNIIFISSKNKKNTNKILNIMDNYNINNAYILGYTNSGKSTLINTISKKDTITTSSMPNTTIDFMNIKIDNKILTDTPGFTLDKTYQDNNKSKITKSIPKKEITPRTYQTKESLSLEIEDIIISNLNTNSLTCYLSNDMNITKKYNKEYNNLVTLDIKDNTDLVIKSLGFINIKKQCSIKVSNNIIDLIELRPSIFGGYNA